MVTFGGSGIDGAKRKIYQNSCFIVQGLLLQTIQGQLNGHCL
jgi:hypothetical protein